MRCERRSVYPSGCQTNSPGSGHHPRRPTGSPVIKKTRTAWLRSGADLDEQTPLFIAAASSVRRRWIIKHQASRILQRQFIGAVPDRCRAIAAATETLLARQRQSDHGLDQWERVDGRWADQMALRAGLPKHVNCRRRQAPPTPEVPGTMRRGFATLNGRQ